MAYSDGALPLSRIPQSARHCGAVPGTVVVVDEEVVGGTVVAVVDVVVVVEVVVVDVVVDVGTGGAVRTSSGLWSDSREPKSTPSLLSATSARVTSVTPARRSVTSHSAQRPLFSVPELTAGPGAAWPGCST